MNSYLKTSPLITSTTDRGENLYLTLGRTDLEKNEESASAEGAKLRLPKARSPSRLGGLGERRKPTQFLTFSAKMEYIFGYVNLIFFSNQIEKIIDE